MRFLIDTNVLISSEPTRVSDVEVATETSLEVARLAAGAHQLLLHPNAVREVEQDRDVERRAIRLRTIGRYGVLESPPAIQSQLIKQLGDVDPMSHHHHDHELLAAVYGDAVNGLITQDDGIHRKARRLRIEARVLSVQDAVGLFRTLANQRPDFVPSTQWRPLYTVPLKDSFFDSLRTEYGKFDEWYRSSARDGRNCWTVDGPSGEIAGICIVKPGDDEWRIGGNVAKVSTFKVAEQFKGNRYGELLLKALFGLAAKDRWDATWITAFPHHGELVSLLDAFGFRQIGESTEGEVVLAKRFSASDRWFVPHSPLEYHIAFGPPAVQPSSLQTFLVPIQPRFHAGLSPDAPSRQPRLAGLPPPSSPYGNALRKAYVCHAPIRSILPGATLLFYRSHDEQAVTAVGVVEDTLVSPEWEVVLTFVSSRTVYSVEDIKQMTRSRPVLAILFRQDRFVDPPMELDELMEAGVVRGAPQTVGCARPEGFEWLLGRINA